MTKQDPTLKVEVHHDTAPCAPDMGKTYMSCAKCLDEWEESFRGTCSPKEYARQQAAITVDGGIQVWCTRHECNITTMTLRAVRAKEI